MNKQQKEVKADYKAWMDSVCKDSDLKNKKLLVLEKAGVPTELKAKHVIERLGYQCRNFRYATSEKGPVQSIIEFASKDIKYPELDIHAMKLFKQINLKNIMGGDSTIAFYVRLVGECKYFNKEDILAFRDKNKSDFVHFPLLLNGEKLFPLTANEAFKFPIETNRVIEFDAASETHNDFNLGDSRMHDACEQIMRALTYLMLRELPYKKQHYKGLAVRSDGKWMRQNQDGTIKEISEKGIIDDLWDNIYSKQGKEILFGLFDWLPIDVVFPIIIINEYSGFIEVKYDDSQEKFKLVDFEDKGYGLYYYVSESVNKYSVVLEDQFQHAWFGTPIIICNLKYLEECLRTVESALEKVIEEMELEINKNPKILLEELLFPAVEKKDIKFNQVV